jgi:hypothetical protein
MKIGDKVFTIFNEVGIINVIKHDSYDEMNIGVLFNGHSEVLWMKESDLELINEFKTEFDVVNKYEICPFCQEKSLQTTSNNEKFCCNPDCNREENEN